MPGPDLMPYEPIPPPGQCRAEPRLDPAVVVQHGDHLRAVLDGVGAGLMSFDARLGLRYTNSRLSALLDIPSRVVRNSHTVLELLEGCALLDQPTVQRLHEACVAASSATDGREHVCMFAAENRTFTLQVGWLHDGPLLATIEETTDRRAAEASALERAMCDPLTGLPSRQLFHSRVAAALGPADAVETTFERIQCDERHSDVTSLQSGSIAAREFPD